MKEEYPALKKMGEYLGFAEKVGIHDTITLTSLCNILKSMSERMGLYKAISCSTKKAKLAMQGTVSPAVKGKSKQPSKQESTPPPKPQKENDKFVMKVGSQPPLELVTPANNEISQPSAKQAASPSE